MYATLQGMRIVSLSPSSTEIAFAIGAGEDLVAVTHLCDYPSDADRVERVGTWLHTDPNRLLDLRPDLIITTTVLPEELQQHSALRERTLHLQPTGLGSVFESILELGRTVGRQTAAEEVVRNMHQSFESIQDAQPLHRLHVYCEEWASPPMAAGNWVPEIVQIAGGRPIGGVHTNPSAPTDVDALRSADPDVMIFHWCSPQERHDPERIRQRPGWGKFRAVQAGALAFIPNSLLNRPGPRLVDGASALQAALQRFQRMR